MTASVVTGGVDLSKQVMLTSEYRNLECDSNCHPAVDFCDDGDVDLSDLAELLGHCGETCE